MRVLCVGDVVGKPGRQAVTALLPDLRHQLGVDTVIANGENLAAGRGITSRTAQELLDAGVDVITSGNHVFDQREGVPFLDSDAPVLRPLNYPPGVPGRGLLQRDSLVVMNLMGRTFMGDIDCPFRTADAVLAGLEPGMVVVVDMHAEATSEKVAMGRYLDGRVSAVFGTHTHVPTADARILPGGTAVVTDVGMVGPTESIIGNEIEAVLQRFLAGLPTRMPVAEKSPAATLNAVLIDIDETTGRARDIRRIDREVALHE